jgi:hypothetical protein
MVLLMVVVMVFRLGTIVIRFMAGLGMRCGLWLNRPRRYLPWSFGRTLRLGLDGHRARRRRGHMVGPLPDVVCRSRRSFIGPGRRGHTVRPLLDVVRRSRHSVIGPGG